MTLIDIDKLDKNCLYVITGGEGYFIPFGLYRCDDDGATYGDPIETVDIEKLII